MNFQEIVHLDSGSATRNNSIATKTRSLMKLRFLFYLSLFFLPFLWVQSAQRIWTDVQGRRVMGEF
ncbi:uncharacterized protein METZ01_LOCUS143284, partial [marine metagenome]